MILRQSFASHQVNLSHMMERAQVMAPCVQPVWCYFEEAAFVESMQQPTLTTLAKTGGNYLSWF